MLSQTDSDSPNKPTNSLSQLARNMFSENNNSNIMLAAIVSLLLVILFVLLLHLYAKWFLAQAQSRSQARRRRLRGHRRRTPAAVSGSLGPSRLHHFHTMNIEDSPVSTKGLDSATVSAIPMFVFKAEEEAEELECAICLSAFEEGEIGRSLPKCGHSFHVECIDMWLSSHCSCPICRAPIVCGFVQNDSQLASVDGDDDDDDDDGDGDPGVLEIVIGTPSYEISESERGNESGNDNYGGGGGVSGSVSSETLSSLLGSSFKRMLSKVFLSSNVNELDGSQ